MPLMLILSGYCIPRWKLGVLCICDRYSNWLLVCALHPAVLIQTFSNSGHMSLVPRSRCQFILGALKFHMCPLWGQKGFSCRDFSFQPIFFIWWSRWLYRVVSETVMHGTSGTRFSPYYHPCFWLQNYAFTNVSLKTHVFSANMN